MSQDNETMPEWMSTTPVMDDIDYFFEHGLDEALSKKVSAMIEEQADRYYETEAEVDILDWVAEKDPEGDPENYTCWKYEEYKQYMRDTFSYVPAALWTWFDFDNMLMSMWVQEKYDIVYYDGTELVLLEDVPLEHSVGSWFKNHPDKSKFFILQYGKPPVHPLL